MLSSPALSPRNTERRAQELLYEFLKTYFNGQPHQSHLGDVTFPACDFLFNQTEVPTATTKPQLHCVFTKFNPTEKWWSSGKLETWTEELSSPASGVHYGLTVRKKVQEAIHGKPFRLLDATNIRWRQDGTGLHEEIFSNNAWITERSWPGGVALRWERSGNLYNEIVTVNGTSQVVRTIEPTNPVWDGTTKQVCAESIITIFVRVANGGSGDNSSEFKCREVADNLKELFESEDSNVLASKGMRNVRILSGPTPMAAQDCKTRMVTIQCGWRYLVPLLH